MLSLSLKIALVASFIALTTLFWRVGKRPGWRLRTVVYGWGAIILWALSWAILLPRCFKGVMDPQTIAITFPDGTLVAAAICGGWFWPLAIVTLSADRQKAAQRKHDSAGS